LLASGGFDRHLRRLRPLYVKFITEMAPPRYRNFIRLNAPFWSPATARAIGCLGDLAAHLAKAKS